MQGDTKGMIGTPIRGCYEHAGVTNKIPRIYGIVNLELHKQHLDDARFLMLMEIRISASLSFLVTQTHFIKNLVLLRSIE